MCPIFTQDISTLNLQMDHELKWNHNIFKHAMYLFSLCVLFLRMTILPNPEKLKVLLEKLKEFHLRFLEEYSQQEPQTNRNTQDQHREMSKKPD